MSILLFIRSVSAGRMVVGCLKLCVCVCVRRRELLQVEGVKTEAAESKGQHVIILGFTKMLQFTCS